MSVVLGPASQDAVFKLVLASLVLQCSMDIALPSLPAPLTLIRMAVAYMTPKTLNRYNSKWPEEKICFSYIYYLIF
jgi:hypothetical protein